VYGLPEMNRAALQALAAKRAQGQAVLVAAPGCYPTASTLAVAPVFAAGLVAPGYAVVVNALSGVSGSGRKPTATTHLVQAGENANAYNVGHHRHTPEIAQNLAQLGGGEVRVVFTPHLIPIKRGLLSTVTVELAAGVGEGEIRDAYESYSANEPLVGLLPAGRMPRTASVAGSAGAQVGWALAAGGATLVASCAIDNLGKGAAAQAVQCANIVLGLPETAGLLTPTPVV
jgi:N-acetyl-gamma-glutamyl-phosphate reductase